MAELRFGPSARAEHPTQQDATNKTIKHNMNQENVEENKLKVGSRGGCGETTQIIKLYNSRLRKGLSPGQLALA